MKLVKFTIVRVMYDKVNNSWLNVYMLLTYVLYTVETLYLVQNGNVHQKVSFYIFPWNITLFATLFISGYMQQFVIYIRFYYNKLEIFVKWFSKPNINGKNYEICCKLVPWIEWIFYRFKLFVLLFTNFNIQNYIFVI